MRCCCWGDEPSAEGEAKVQPNVGERERVLVNCCKHTTSRNSTQTLLPPQLDLMKRRREETSFDGEEGRSTSSRERRGARGGNKRGC